MRGLEGADYVASMRERHDRQDLLTLAVIVALLVILCAIAPLAPARSQSRGDANVQREIPHARKVFGKRDKAAWRKFNYMRARFEKPGGFCCEASMFAALAVLQGK